MGSAEEDKIYEAVEEVIEEKVAKCVAGEMKTGAREIDEAAIRERCTDEVLSEMGVAMEEVQRRNADFLKRLQMDDADLFKKLTENMASKVDPSAKMETFHDVLESAKRMKPDSDVLERFYAAGQHYFDAKDFESACQYFDFVAQLDSGEWKGWFLKGLALQNLGRFLEAVEAYMMVLELEPRHINAAIQLVNSLYLLGHMEQAREIFEHLDKEADLRSVTGDDVLVENIRFLRETLCQHV